MLEIKPRKRIIGNEMPDGALFGSAAKFPDKGSLFLDNLARDVKRERRLGITTSWDYHSEPIEKYAGVLQEYPIAEILVDKIRAHNETKVVPFRVLDAGIGSGQQWFDFARKNGLVIGVDFEVCGTSLTKNGVIPELKSQVKICTANNIHLKFRREAKFDFVISHYGMHGLEETGIESAFRVLKPEGELFVCGIWKRPIPKLVAGHDKYAKLIKSHPGPNIHLTDGKEWFLHLKKK